MAASGAALVSEAPTPEQEEVPAEKRKTSIVISKSSLKRLAHDVGARVGKDCLEQAFEKLQGYVASVLDAALLAMSFARKKSISLSHVRFAAEACGSVPNELRELSAEHLVRLLKSNPQAPALLRKDVLWRAEISEASFGKVVKKLLNARASVEGSGHAARITVQARRLLQLLGEYRVMLFFDKKNSLSSRLEQTPRVGRKLAQAFSCTATKAQELAQTLEHLEARMEALLSLGSAKTVDERLIRTALSLDLDWVADWTPPPEPHDASRGGVAKRCTDRLLRAAALEKRVTPEAVSFLTACLLRASGASSDLPGSLSTEAAAPVASSEQASLPPEQKRKRKPTAADATSVVSSPAQEGKPVDRPRKKLRGKQPAEVAAPTPSTSA